MTTTLIPAGDARNDGRQQYEPIAARVSRVSQYDASTFGFRDLPGFWRWNGMPPLQVGSSYVLYLATKPKPPGPNTRAGSQYMDIDAAEPLTAENCPEGFEVRYDEQGGAHGYALGDPATAPGVSEHVGSPETPANEQPAGSAPVSGDYRDPTRASIERQVAVKGYVELLNGQAYERLSVEQVDYLVGQTLDGLYTLWHGEPPSRPEPPDYADQDAAADAAYDANREAV